VSLISFLSNNGFVVNDLSGSGLGFYGYGGFSTSVQVGAYQDNTYITNANGTATDSLKVNNVKWMDPASGQIAEGDIRYLRAIPNYLGTLNIRFTNNTPVKTQNAQLRIFDRSSIDNPASGVVTKVAVLIHPWNTQSPDGSGDLAWRTPGGSGSIVTFADFPSSVSPGSGGFSPLGSNTVDTRHDWYVAMSAMPTSIGSKNQYALSFSCEFL
jgi:hypothetical protein